MNRREVLRLIGHGGAGLSMAAMQSSLLAATDGTGYKAVVCIFLYGGNDQSNTIVPTNAAAYSQYLSLIHI